MSGISNLGRSGYKRYESAGLLTPRCSLYFANLDTKYNELKVN